ncbi:MAG: hypothetical protein QXU72_08615 [Thermofilum sp.]
MEWRFLDLEDAPSVKGLVGRVEPEVIVHAAAYTDIDGWRWTGSWPTG